jgi:hypothetical protein
VSKISVLLAGTDGIIDGAETLLATEDTSEAYNFIRHRIEADLAFAKMQNEEIQ